MTTAILQLLLKSCACISGLLLIGAFLRAKVPIFRKLLLPASVIGGFVGLLLGPNLLGNIALLPFPEEIVSTWSLLPGILILPIFASVPLGMFMGEDKNQLLGFKKQAPKVMMSCGVFASTYGIQLIIGLGISLILMKFMPSLNIYRTFGFEMSQGFNGGHGTAGALGNILQGFGAEYWEVAQGVATTYATIGLIGGMLLGIFFINRATKKGNTSVLKEVSQMPKSTAYGFNSNVKEQGVLGRETTISCSIETLTIHLGLIILVSGLSYWLMGLATTYNIPGFSSLPVWFYGLLLMYIVNFAIIGLKLDWLIDSRVKSRITGTMSDFAITAAIASMPIKAVIGYIIPIIIISCLGFIATYFTTIVSYRFFFKKDCPFERGVMSWGVNTGVMINGLMLLKICDPDYSTPALSDFSMGFALMSIIDIFTAPIMWSLVGSGSTMQLFMYGVIFTLFYITMAFVGKYLNEKNKITALK